MIRLLHRSSAAAAALSWLLAAPPAHSFTSQAYAALLRTHVRTGTLDGVRLNAVDYRGVKADRNYSGGPAEGPTGNGRHCPLVGDWDPWKTIPAGPARGGSLLVGHLRC
jgi:hypothetical protein